MGVSILLKSILIASIFVVSKRPRLNGIKSNTINLGVRSCSLNRNYQSDPKLKNLFEIGSVTSLCQSNNFLIQKLSVLSNSL